MIKAIAHQKLDLSKEEYTYYLELEKSFGKDAFVGLFRTNDRGHIVSVMPPQAGPTAMILIFFLLNVMFNQRLRSFEGWMKEIEKIEKRVLAIEQKLEERD
jgi:hypothetical protein